MSGNREVPYALHFCANKQSRKGGKGSSPGFHLSARQAANVGIPRIARLMALAIRFEGLLRAGTIRDYVQLARLGRVTRARRKKAAGA